MKPASVLQFDLRSGPTCPDSRQTRYQACLEMVKWADQSGISVVGFSEHHNTADGFLSSPLMMAAAAAQATSKVALSVSALLLPLHDPLRIAEDIAVLDLLSGGRFTAVVGLGYREVEYQTLGVDWSSRGAVMDEKLDVLLKALRGERFSYRGAQVQLNPAPVRPPHSLVCVGGNSKAAAKRAARFGLMFAPAIDDPTLQQAYDAACEEVGFAHVAVIYPNEPSLTLISQNPDRAWSKGSINLSPLCGGTPVEYAWRSLELFGSKVLPHFSQ